MTDAFKYEIKFFLLQLLLLFNLQFHFIAQDNPQYTHCQLSIIQYAFCWMSEAEHKCRKPIIICKTLIV